MRSLEGWDEQYLEHISSLGADETTWLEKKASQLFDPRASRTHNEIAKQVSAFSNAGGGFLVFGIDNSGAIDQGLAPSVGRQPVKEWIEALVPGLCTPAVTGCEARFISHARYHQDGAGALVLHIPSSDARPHWVTRSNPQVAYLRVGAHSGPMSLQTFQDLLSRTTAGVAAIEDPSTWEVAPAQDRVFLEPRVRVLSGAVAELWSLVVSIEHDVGILLSEFAKGARQKVGREMSFQNYQPLFPGASVPVHGFICSLLQ